MARAGRAPGVRDQCAPGAVRRGGVAGTGLDPRVVRCEELDATVVIGVGCTTGQICAMSQVAFVGLGRMGRGMATRPLDAGHELAVFNRTPDRAGELVAAGARLASSLRDAADGASVVVVMVSDDGASRSVWLGPEGILAADLAPGSYAVECSTLSYDWVLQLADEVTCEGDRRRDSRPHRVAQRGRDELGPRTGKFRPGLGPVPAFPRP